MVINIKSQIMRSNILYWIIVTLGFIGFSGKGKSVISR